MNNEKSLVAAILLLVSSSFVYGHHGVSKYDMDEVLTLDGKVQEWDWRSPHTWLRLSVTGPDGSANVIDIEGAPPRWMTGQGWSPESLKSGEPVTITYHPLKSGNSGGILMEVERAGGEALKVNRPGRLGGP